MSEKTFKTWKFLPIHWGWLKALPCVILLLGWLGAFVYLLLQLRNADQSATVTLLLTLLVFSFVSMILLMLAMVTKTIHKSIAFLKDYTVRNVFGVNLFVYINNNQLQADTEDVKKFTWPTGQKALKIPLGGWRPKDAKLLVYKTNDHLLETGPHKWVTCKSWEIRIKHIWACCLYEGRLDNVQVLLSDTEGNTVTTDLQSALFFIRDHKGSLLHTFPEWQRSTKLVTDLQQRLTLLAELVKSAIDDLERTKRFGASQPGMEIKKRLDRELGQLWPGYTPRFQSPK